LNLRATSCDHAHHAVVLCVVDKAKGVERGFAKERHASEEGLGCSNYSSTRHFYTSLARILSEENSAVFQRREFTKITPTKTNELLTL
jgi:hypothetical protein